jgi:5-(carboxyamino)imidazole ribonucleotide synthase
MFAMAARRMGYLVHTFSPETDTPTGQVADFEVTASYDDLDAVRDFAGRVNVVTFEFENVPAATVEALGGIVPVRPNGAALYTTQHYDGKGQRLIKLPAEGAAAFDSLGGQEAILESFVDFEREVSVVCARGADGRTAHFGVVENSHERHILDCTVAPARVSPQIARQATEIAESLAEQLALVGVLCVEFFLTRDGRLFVNELAPRPHNSGHFTIDACTTSQFEQQVRAVCGLPLGATEQLRPAAMANLLGDLWQGGNTPDWRAACAIPNVKLHLYGKHEARVGRKMGHLTALAPTTDEALRLVRAAREALTSQG